MASSLLLVCAALAVFAGASAYAPDVDNVYHLFSRRNPTVSQPMLLGWPTLIAPNFDPSLRTAVIMHEWNSGPTADFIATMVPAVIVAGDINIIIVDWSVGAAEADFNTLIDVNMPLGAESVARFIVWLNEVTGGNVALYHLVGFEVGAHMAGLVGRLLGGAPNFVTALNPSRQGFNESNMFRPTDGLFTDAIHTDIFGTGMMEAVAVVDYYPNGGLGQPGCHPFDWVCSRDRAYQYFAESLVTGGFMSTGCDTVADAVAGTCDGDNIVLGGMVNKTGLSGIYYLETNAQPPYSKG